MSLNFRSTRPDEIDALRAFLLRIFEAPPESLFARKEHLLWKYFAGRGTPAQSHSFVYENDRQFVSHLCAWPFSVSLNGQSVEAAHPIDWAASPDVPGAGALLLRQIRGLSDLTCCVGGTDAARKVIAAAGFKPVYTMKYYSRPLRPWKQFLSHGRRNHKLPARLLRNAFWSTTAGSAMPPGWSATQIEPEELPPELIPVSDSTVTVCVRTPELFRYFTECPIARYSLFTAKKEGQLRGYFLISHLPGQANIADAWVRTGEGSDWTALYKLAAAIAHKESDAAEIVAGSAIELGQKALEDAGFRSHQVLPVMMFDRKKLLQHAPPIHLQAIDNDGSFLHNGKPNYWT